MKTERNHPYVSISDKGARFLRSGHVWVYGDEITALSGEAEPGGIVDVVDRKGRYLGSGFYNPHSKIRVRVISKNANDRFDEAFFERRINYAIDYRMTVLGGDLGSCRIIFGESDGFPGLTVDKFENVLVSQTLSLGTEKRKDVIFPLLVRAFSSRGIKIDGIYERNEAQLREKEGMEKEKGFYPFEGADSALPGRVTITENGIKYEVDYINGQKTGFFLDQRFNRLAAGRIAKGKRVLDCFTHTGAFALNCAFGGAEHVTAVDISADAIGCTRKNIGLNGMDERIDTLQADVFDLLTDLNAKKSREYDMIILDPPAFTKSGDTVSAARRGYKEINMKAMRLLPRGGWLATCSCSHFMTDTMFREMLLEAANDAGVSLLQVEARQQSPDHPILHGVPETDYLKFYLFRVV